VNVNTPEAGAFGAALLGAVGKGAYPDVQTACAVMIAGGERVQPGANRSAYEQPYARYQQLYPALKPFFAD
jgi:xylulokinase